MGTNIDLCALGGDLVEADIKEWFIFEGSVKRIMKKSNHFP